MLTSLGQYFGFLSKPEIHIAFTNNDTINKNIIKYLDQTSLISVIKTNKYLFHLILEDFSHIIQNFIDKNEDIYNLLYNVDYVFLQKLYMAPNTKLYNILGINMIHEKPFNIKKCEKLLWEEPLQFNLEDSWINHYTTYKRKENQLLILNKIMICAIKTQRTHIILYILKKIEYVISQEQAIICEDENIITDDICFDEFSEDYSISEYIDYIQENKQYFGSWLQNFLIKWLMK